MWHRACTKPPSSCHQLRQMRKSNSPAARISAIQARLSLILKSFTDRHHDPYPRLRE
jgi:hypothetical protein